MQMLRTVMSNVATPSMVVIADHHRLCQQRLAAALQDVKPALKVRTVPLDLASVSQVLSNAETATLVVSCCEDSVRPLSLLFNVRARFPRVKLVALHAPPRLQTTHAPGQQAIETVIHGATGVHALLRTVAAPVPSESDAIANHVGRHLTPREIDVVGHVAAGLRNAEIADAIGIKEKTVKVNLTNIFAKLGIRRREELIALAPHLLGAPEAQVAHA